MAPGLGQQSGKTIVESSLKWLKADKLQRRREVMAAERRLIGFGQLGVMPPRPGESGNGIPRRAGACVEVKLSLEVKC